MAAAVCREVSERLVGSPAFKAGGTGDPRPAGSIPVHLRARRDGDEATVTEGDPAVSAAPRRLAAMVKKLLLLVALGGLLAFATKKVRAV